MRKGGIGEELRAGRNRQHREGEGVTVDAKGQVYVLDEKKGKIIMRGSPQPGSVFLDDTIWPQADRRACFVIARDETGQLGVPSVLGWAVNMP